VLLLLLLLLLLLMRASTPNATVTDLLKGFGIVFFPSHFPSDHLLFKL